MNDDDVSKFALTEPSPYAIQVPVLKVFDGDGFLTQIKFRQSAFNPSDQLQVEIAVRFGFIDAPELEQPGGLEAKEFLTTLIGGHNVWIDILTKMDTGQFVDRYSRIVAVPFLEYEHSPSSPIPPLDILQRANPFRPSNFVVRNVELEMVLNGWARVLERYGPDDRYFEALKDARSNKRGIWALENNLHPWTFKQQRASKQQRHRKFARAGPRIKCPKQGCGGYLVNRSGRYGEFLGCSNYPKCRYSRSISTK